MAKLRVEDLANREFEIAHSSPPVLQGAQLSSVLASVRGKRILLEFDRTLDGPQTASRLIRETMTSHGASFVTQLPDADVAAWIGGTGGAQFAFVVMDAKDHARYRCYLCGPRELTAAIMTTITLSVASDDIESLDDPNENDRRRTEDDLIARGESAVDLLLQSVAKLNAALLSGQNPERNMAALERRIHALGRTRNPRGARAIVDALADAAGTVDVLKRQVNETYEHPNPMYRHDMLLLASGRQAAAESLCKAAVMALAEIGAPALTTIERSMPNSSPPAQKALRRAATKIRGPWWKFWK